MLWNWCTNEQFNYELEYIFSLQNVGETLKLL